MKKPVIFAMLFFACIFLNSSSASAQAQEPVKYNDWIILTVGPTTVENAINSYLATDEWAMMRGFEFMGVYINMGRSGHTNAFAAMCIDDGGRIYAFIFDSSGELLEFYQMGIFW